LQKLEGGGQMAEKSARSNELENELTLEQAKEQLIEKGKKQGARTYEVVSNQLAHYELDSDQMDEFYENLTDQGVEL